MDDIYEPLKEFEQYEINRNGNIRNKKTHKVIQPCNYGTIYPWIILYKGVYDENDILVKTTRHKKYIHRLVALQFFENPENKPQVDHIDGDELNYKASNLRWATRDENAANVVRQNIRVRKYKRRNGGNPLYFWETKKGDEIHKSAHGFNTREEARESYKCYHKQLHGEFSPY